MAVMWRPWSLAGLLAGLAVAQFPPKPEGLTLVQSKFHENVTLSFKEVGQSPLLSFGVGLLLASRLTLKACLGRLGYARPLQASSLIPDTSIFHEDFSTMGIVSRLKTTQSTRNCSNHVPKSNHVAVACMCV